MADAHSVCVICAKGQWTYKAGSPEPCWSRRPPTFSVSSFCRPHSGLSDRLRRSKIMLWFSKICLTMAVVTALVQGIDAQNITASTCADPVGFHACYQQAMSRSLRCSADTGSDLSRLTVCGCALDFAEIECALESCWNVVQ